MLVRSVSHSPIVLLAVLFIYISAPQALAHQVTLSYTDSNATAQTIVLDCNTSGEDLALATRLIGQEGMVIANDPDAGCGTLAEIAAAVSTEAPIFAPGRAEAFAYVSYDDAEMIATAYSMLIYPLNYSKQFLPITYWETMHTSILNDNWSLILTA